MVKTTIDLDDELWKKFSIRVIQDFGGRSKNDVIEALVDEFVKDPSKAKIVKKWIEERKEKKK